MRKMRWAALLLSLCLALIPTALSDELALDEAAQPEVSIDGTLDEDATLDIPTEDDKLDIEGIAQPPEVIEGGSIDLESEKLDLPGAEVAQPEDGGAFQMLPLVGVATDYSLARNWLQIPAITKPVDTIYLYPTTYADTTEGAPAIASIDDPAMRAGARSVFGSQSGVFAESTNVFAPFYRQSNLAALLGKDDKAFMEFQFQEQRTDVYAAFDYYFEHFNEGRPFILAGHSQGSMMLKIALREYFQEHAELLDRMVAAYVVGFSITHEDLAINPALKFAEGADDTGVIVSWNTEGPENREAKSAVVTSGAISINPIRWTRDDTYVPASENPGSRLSNMGDGVKRDTVPGLADAQVDLERGVVICTTMPQNYLSVAGLLGEDAPNPFGPASLHGVDYEAYYYSVQANVAARIRAYLAKE